MTESLQQDLVRGTLHRAENATAGIVLAHGAGSDSNAKIMVALATAFAEAGVDALRIDLPFRQAGRTPHPSRAGLDRGAIRDAVRLLPEYPRVFVGGHSYGGRQASMLLAEDPSVALALLLLSYPLHPPAKADQLRTAHFPNLQTPCLFVHGTRDPFGSPDEMREALTLIPARNELYLIEKAGHELKPVITDPSEIVQRFLISAA
jgi:predicted alpha/beta-hydrolase family hydrolase